MVEKILQKAADVGAIVAANPAMNRWVLPPSALVLHTTQELPLAHGACAPYLVDLIRRNGSQPRPLGLLPQPRAGDGWRPDTDHIATTKGVGQDGLV
jgi:hypothetical protein